MPTPRAFPAARLLFSLDPGVAHLNHGSFGAVPVPVQRAQQRLRDETDADPMRFFAQGLADRIAHTRRHIAGFLGADPDATALTANVTTGIATVLLSLGLRDRDEIVVTDHGYHAVDLAVDRERRLRGVSVRVVRLPLTASDDDVVAAVSEAVTPGRTRLVIADQITSPTARLLPVVRLAAALRRMDVPLLVDAAHAPGMLALPVSEIGADFWVGNLHKWAFAPRGTAALVVAPRWQERIEPLVVSHEYGAGFPTALDWQGTLDYTGWLAAPVGLHVLRMLGLDAVRRYNAGLARYGQRVVGSALGIDPADLPVPSDGLSMSLIPLPTGVATTQDSANALRLRIAAKLNTQVAINVWAGRAYLRLSAQIYNDADEYDRLAEGLPDLVQQPDR